MIGLAIQKAGATLISVTENIDETPSGRLLHGIMATIAEFYSRNLAAEALKGATQKAKRGGTPYRAPLGYINITTRINEREARTVAIDPDRAAHITWAFKKYATGDYSIKMISDALYRRGFRKRRTGRSVSKALSRNGVATMLHSRYYIGYVKYRGIEYRGRHKPLVSAAVFANVQALLSDRRKGDKKRKHNHYLTGLVCCGKCGRRLTYTVTKGIYEYLFCTSRQQGYDCNQSYIPIRLIEDAIAKKFCFTNENTINRTSLQKEVKSQLRYEIQSSRDEMKYQEKRLTRLLMERQRILQAFYDEEVTGNILGSEQKRINKEIEELKKVIAEAAHAYTTAKQCYDAALEMTANLNLEKAYKEANPPLKRYLGRALYTKIYIDDAIRIGIFGTRKEHDVSVNHVDMKQNIDYQQLAQAVIGLTSDESINI
jgi:uncharacterized protein YbaR (Trm112 family)